MRTPEARLGIQETRSMTNLSVSLECDYVVVGGGSAGAVVASRLSENPAIKVVLLEAGPGSTSYWGSIPVGFGKIISDDRYTWNHVTEPEPYLDDRQVPLLSGKVLGGSSSINGLVYVRGFPYDYSLWRQMGAEGWGYEGVLPYFKKAERQSRGANDYHGDSGPLGVEDPRWRTPLSEAFLAACDSVGLARNNDFAGEKQAGVGYYQLTSWKGRRSSTADAYIKPVQSRRNLHIVTGATVKKIVFENRTAVGVFYHREGDTLFVRVTREVILSAGALKTPQILELSGIGPAKLLQDFGLPVVHDLKSVGENLMDHVQSRRVYTTTSPETFNKRLGSPVAQMFSGIRYYATRGGGPLGSGPVLANGYISTNPPDNENPDFTIHLLPFLPGPSGYDLAKNSGFMLTTFQNRPDSRGFVRIKSRNEYDSPAVQFNYFSTEGERKGIISAMNLIKDIGSAPALKRLGAEEILPGPMDVDDEGLFQYIKDSASTCYHFSGTARMGTDDLSVVDPSLRVRGVDGLRVIDASVMPSVVSANTNAATIMIGEKGADLILNA